MDSASQLAPSKEDDHTYHMLSARVTRRESSGEVLDFKVFCNRVEDTESGEVETNVASLKGFVHFSLEMPSMADFDIYDERSQHCLQAHDIMRKRRALIKKQLPHIDFGIIDQVILLEKLWVEPAYRGQELGLRLMQEARHLFARPQAFVILKAHPDGENVTDADCLKLADYYCSSQLLGLKPLSKRALPGWLVGSWWAPLPDDNDPPFWWPREDHIVTT